MFVRVNENDCVNMQLVFSTNVKMNAAKKFQVSFFGMEDGGVVKSYEFAEKKEAAEFLGRCITDGCRRDLKEFKELDGQAA